MSQPVDARTEFVANRRQSMRPQRAKDRLVTGEVVEMELGRREQILIGSYVVAISIIGVVCVYLEASELDDGTKAFTTMRAALFAFLLFEFLCRLVAEHLLHFWRNPYNMLLVAMTVVWTPLFSDRLYGARSLIIFRIAEYAMHLPKFRTLLYGIVGGLSMMVCISLAIMILIYVYGIVGLTMFRENDPWHFGDLQRAMTSLFRAATLEDWTEIFYVNYYGCDVYNAGIYVNTDVNHTLKFSNCVAPRSRPSESIAFFFTFIILCLAMFAMFIGALSIEMADAVKDVHRETEVAKIRANQRAMIERTKKRMNTLTNRMVQKESDPKLLSEHRLTTITKLNQQNVVACLLREIFEGRSCPYEEIPESTHWRRQYLALSRMAARLVQSTPFTAMIISALGISAILLGIDTSAEAKQEFGITDDGLKVWNVATGVIFLVELVLKFMACEFEPQRFLWTDKYQVQVSNVFDVFVVVANIVTLSYEGSTWVVLLRVSRLLIVFSGDTMKDFPSMRLPILTIVMSFELLCYTVAVLLVVVFCFSALAVSNFKSNDPFHFGSLNLAMITLFRCGTLEDWSDVLYTQMYGCDAYAPAAGFVCGASEKQPVTGLLFFIAFVCVVALILVNAFTGVIVTQMEEAVIKIKAEMHESKKLRRVMRAHGIRAQQVHDYMRIFDRIDLSHDGKIELEELQAALHHANLIVSRKSVKIVMTNIDPLFSTHKGINRVAFVELIARMKHNIDSKDRVFTLNETIAGQYITEQYRKMRQRKQAVFEASQQAMISQLQEQVRLLTEKCGKLEEGRAPSASRGNAISGLGGGGSGSPIPQVGFVQQQPARPAQGMSHTNPDPITTRGPLNNPAIMTTRIFV